MIINHSKGIIYNLGLSGMIVIMFIVQDTNCGITYDRHLIIIMFTVQATGVAGKELIQLIQNLEKIQKSVFLFNMS